MESEVYLAFKFWWSASFSCPAAAPSVEVFCSLKNYNQIFYKIVNIN